MIVIIVGCTHYQARPIEPGGSLVDFEARRLDAAEIRGFLHDEVGIDQWPPTVWDLRSLTLAALFYSPEMDVARARWGVAEAGTVTAGARPNPSLDPSLGYNSTSKLITPWIPELILSLPVETAGKRGFRVSRARELSEAARLDVLHTAWMVRSGVRRAYVDLYRAGEMKVLLDRPGRSLLPLHVTHYSAAANDGVGAPQHRNRVARGAGHLFGDRQSPDSALDPVRRRTRKRDVSQES